MPFWGEYKTCKDAFLFSMVNPYGLGPTKMPLKTQRQQTAIYFHSGYGPVFGAGNDLAICSDANTNALSCSSLGHTYERPPGQQATFFSGGTFFTVKDYEVFGLHT